MHKADHVLEMFPSVGVRSDYTICICGVASAGRSTSITHDEMGRTRILTHNEDRCWNNLALFLGSVIHPTKAVSFRLALSLQNFTSGALSLSD